MMTLKLGDGDGFIMLPICKLEVESPKPPAQLRYIVLHTYYKSTMLPSPPRYESLHLPKTAVALCNFVSTL